MAAAGASSENSGDPEWVHTLKQGGVFPLADSQPCSHGWASPPGNNFFVRGPHYLETKAKVPGGEPLLQPIAFDIIKSSSKISNFMEHPQCRVRAALRAARGRSAKPPAVTDAGDGGVQEPFVWAFNLQLPSKDQNHISLVMYYVSFHSPEKGSLMQRFVDGDDAFRNERLKMLASIPQGPQLVKLVVREKGAACMIGKVLNCTYRREKEYMEVDVNVGSTMIVRALFQLCGAHAAHITSEIAFVIEGRYENELPDRIVGAIRLANLDFSCATSLHDCAALPSQLEPVGYEKQKASCKGLWKPWSKPAKDKGVDDEQISS